MNTLSSAARSVLTLLLATAIWAAPAFGVPAGELDPAFGDHGRILLRDLELGELRGVDVFTEPGSGKLLTVGTDLYSKPNALLRFNSDGSPDLSYGDQGVIRLELGDDSLQIADAELLSDGKWLVAGVMNSYGDEDRIIRGSALLARYLADGMLDASFGNAGRVTLDFGGVYESFGEILLRADGRIVVFGVTDEVGSYDTPRIRPLLAGYTADGERDSGFGNPATPGVSVLNVDAFDEHLYTVVQSADGKLLACGNATRSNGSSKESGAMVARYHSNGMPDNTFGENGAAFFGAYLEAIRTDNCLALADGHLALAGHQGKGEALRGIVLRLAPDGQLDAGFGDDGAVILPTARNSAVSKMLVLSDGALAIAGSHWVPTDNGWFKWSDLLIARLDPATGELDQGFGNDGMTLVDFGARGFSGIATAASLVQQPDGKLVIIGSQIDRYDWYRAFNLAIVRIDPYGAGSNGWAGFDQTHERAPTGGGEISLNVRRTGGTTGALTVDFRTVDDTAKAGTDYIEKSGTLFWWDGDASDRTVAITVPIYTSATGDRGFRVELSNSTGGLAMDQTIVGIPMNAATPFPPPTPRANPPQTTAAGGGAIGIELWCLLILVVLYYLPRPWERRPCRDN